jgi:hypothetical protein
MESILISLIRFAKAANYCTIRRWKNLISVGILLHSPPDLVLESVRVTSVGKFEEISLCPEPAKCLVARKSGHHLKRGREWSAIDVRTSW